MSTVRIDRPNDKPIATDSKPFWPAGRTWVDVTISGGTATSVDDQNHDAFTAELLAEQEAAFLEAVRVGAPGDEITQPSNDNQTDGAGAQANTVIVTDPGPGGGPKKFYEVDLPVAFLATGT